MVSYPLLAQTLLYIALLSPVMGQGIVSKVIAGPGNSGDGQPAFMAFVPAPAGIVADATGNVYIADLATSRIRRVSPLGIITSLAGTGSRGFSGDGGPSSQAQLNSPRGLSLGANGTLYFADSGNHRIRAITSDGTIVTVAGTGQAGFSGDGASALGANLYYPYDVKVNEDGSLYIADNGNNRIRKVTSEGIIQTIAGTGDRGDSSVDGPALQLPLKGLKTLALSPSGEIYLSDWSNRIRKIAGDGTLTTVVGNGTFGFSGDGGPAIAAEIAGPEAITIDQSGTLYISDSWNSRIRRVTPDGVITTAAGSGRFGFYGDGGPATQAAISYPTMLATDSGGNVYFSDFGNARVRKFFAGSTIDTLAGSDDPLDGGKATEGRLLHPYGVAADANGNVYIADRDHNRVRRVTSTGSIQTVAGTGAAGKSGDGRPAAAGALNSPSGLAIDASGNVYIADSLNRAIRQIDTSGVIQTIASGLQWPIAVATDQAGAVYFADQGDHRVRRISPTGAIATIAGNGQPGFSGDGEAGVRAQLNWPQGLAVDAAGYVYIADTDNNRIRVVAPNGIITTLAGTGEPGYSNDEGPAVLAQLNRPAGIALDSLGNLYIADSGNSRIRRISNDGIIHTYAGPEVGLSSPQAVAVDSTGSVFVADTYNLRVLQLTLAP